MNIEKELTAKLKDNNDFKNKTIHRTKNTIYINRV